MNTTCTTAGPLPASCTNSYALHRSACPKARAALLDTLAGIELAHGHAHAAEHLTWQAVALREAGQ